ncbi:uncharacterized protein LOC130944225 [Arachis stenosperma]|uniref:uncharacterized protein LOC130944225 n=1 Tax=Arachis stenosperma TaxID=217475 RepID=UPI0025ABA279|nr:uncharacterized protein LOC130944225 [Arachis stenosperma]XP_057728421.1 uncharacterized protein LOC130944225 [Arachis stenosperma]
MMHGLEFLHVKPGKGAAFVRTKLKNYVTGNTVEKTFRAGSSALEPATLIPLQLLKSTGTKCIMVGDPKQLPATVLSNVASKYLYECSMFERLQRARHPVIMLTDCKSFEESKGCFSFGESWSVSIQAEGLPWCRFPFLVPMRDLVWFSLHGKPKFSNILQLMIGSMFSLWASLLRNKKAKFFCEKNSDEEEEAAAERASEVNFADEISGINTGPPSPTSSINY